MTFYSIKVWLWMVRGRLDMDVAAINGTNNSWKTTQKFKTLCYLNSFSTLGKIGKELQIDLNYHELYIWDWINAVAICLTNTTHHYDNIENCIGIFFLHYRMIFIRLELKQLKNNNLSQISVCSVSLRSSMLTYFNSWLYRKPVACS